MILSIWWAGKRWPRAISVFLWIWRMLQNNWMMRFVCRQGRVLEKRVVSELIQMLGLRPLWRLREGMLGRIAMRFLWASGSSERTLGCAGPHGLSSISRGRASGKLNWLPRTFPSWSWPILLPLPEEIRDLMTAVYSLDQRAPFRWCATSFREKSSLKCSLT